jgi:hypothetical protein
LSDLTEGIARAFLADVVKHTADKGDDFSRLQTFYRWGISRQHADFDPGLFRIRRASQPSETPRSQRPIPAFT